ncbi:hypothetical protein CLV63_102330 [Murinocardiopsis flavida]|uniref:Secreted protein n=1 Tax=Murinocardiopsis flavida TaxID=645275 RepID=A0A2P8DSL0_9ACTN|nr:hypothetical protein [Murinocardiopsis flavida]PSL00203.1 hypothetical protein CLV63_102330 [Murinocardiopsis flavida]
MDIGLIIGVVVVIVIVAAIAGFVLMRKPEQRSKRLKAQFGPEYDRAVSAHGGDRQAAEKELADRKDLHRKLELRDLPEETRRDYTRQWTAIQERFVDAPSEAVGDADRLLTRLMSDRGYPTEGFEEQAALLSVDHARTLDNYRAAHDIAVNDAAGRGSTEDLRNAMVYYRTLFSELLGHDASGHGPAAATSETAPGTGRERGTGDTGHGLTADRPGRGGERGTGDPGHGVPADRPGPATGAGEVPSARPGGHDGPAPPPRRGGTAPREEGGPR